MSRLVLVRIGDPNGLWTICKPNGKWSSPELHEQVVRNMFVEGYEVYIIFVGTGDKLVAVSKVLNVRERNNNDVVIPTENEIGELKTILTFDTTLMVDIRNSMSNYYPPVLDYVRYRSGSQILIPDNLSSTVIPNLIALQIITRGSNIYRGNITVMNTDYWTNLNMNGC